MPFVKVSHCLICDATREEARNKISVLGFFGIAPNVEVVLDNVETPLTELTFLFFGAVTGVGGPVELKVELFDFSDSLVFSGLQKVSIQPSERANLSFNIRLLRFPHAGRYKVRVKVDERPVYDTDFLISRNPATP